MRTNTVEGDTNDLPTIGQPFELRGESLVLPAPAVRLVTTSPVIAVEGDEFLTKSGSVYHYEVL